MIVENGQLYTTFVYTDLVQLIWNLTKLPFKSRAKLFLSLQVIEDEPGRSLFQTPSEDVNTEILIRRWEH